MGWVKCGNTQKISYISSSCAQQLNLPVYMDEDILIKTKVLIPQAYPSETSIINNEWNVNCMAFYIGQGVLVLRDTSSHTVTWSNQPWKWVDIEFKTSDGSLVYDGVTYGGQGGTYNHKVISLFGIENSHFSSVAFQDIDIYKDGDLYMHLIPKKDEITGAGYYYDIINNQSYYSNTSTPLIYIESTTRTIPTFEFKNYLKFNGSGIFLPWTQNSDYKIECVFHEVEYYHDTCITGNSGGYTQGQYIAAYADHFDVGTGGSYSTFSAWSAGEHTYINNDENNQSTLDGENAKDYTPTTNDRYYTLGCRENGGMGYKGYIKSFKIYSKSTGDLLHHLKPCLADNVPALCDVADGNVLYFVSGAKAVDEIPQST